MRANSKTVQQEKMGEKPVAVSSDRIDIGLACATCGCTLRMTTATPQRTCDAMFASRFYGFGTSQFKPFFFVEPCRHCHERLTEPLNALRKLLAETPAD